MSIEIDVLNGDASWPRAEPLMKAVWTAHVVEKLSWGHVKWAHADLRVLIDAPEDAAQPGLACHVGIFFRDAMWDGRKVQIGGIGGVSTREDCSGRLASLPGRGLCRTAAGTGSFRGDGAVRVRFYPQAARRRHRPMRPAVVTPASAAGGLRGVGQIICHP